jgi:methionyl-tRNA synthetase
VDNITYDQFQKLDIRVGTVVEAEVPTWSHWVLKMIVDFGPAFAKATAGERKRTVFAGIMKFFKPDDLIGKQFPFVVNLEPKKIGPEGDMSEAMMLMAVPSRKASDGKAVPEEDIKPVLFQLQEKVPNGTGIM